MKQSRVKVGDFVDFDAEQRVIEKIYPRQNELIRPPVANVEQALIIVAPVPKPDFLLIDKLLIKFLSLNIKPCIVINKIDLNSAELIKQIKAQYEKVCTIEQISALDSEMTSSILLPKLKDTFTVLTGQSAVGKTSVLNCLFSHRMGEVGELSQKTERGKNTTRHSEIFMLQNGGLVADTPGFNAFDLEDFTPEQIIDNYIDFREFSPQCKYNNCNHLGENESICAVKRAVKAGNIDKERYDRFCEIFKIAKQKEDSKYE